MPTDRQYMEDALDLVVSYLNDNFVDLLAAVKNERDDKTTPVPGVIHRGVSRRNAFPKIEVLPSGTGHDYGFEDQPLIRPWLLHNITLRITHQSARIDLVENTVLRYSEVVNRLQEDDDTFGGAFNWVQLQDEDYSYLLESQESKQMLAMMLIPIRCRTL